LSKKSQIFSEHGLVLASRRTNFYEISISNLGAMPQKQNYFAVRAAQAAEELFIF
jgi:hypothetical protein